MKETRKNKLATDISYVNILGLRSRPVSNFMRSLDGPPDSQALQVTSLNEDRLLIVLGVPRSERDDIEGLMLRRSNSRALATTEAQQSARALFRLATNPPLDVGLVQRRTAGWLLRPYPHSCRFSGKNMSPLPGWLAGSQLVALNMSNNDLPLHLHFALFNGSGGYVLKPLEMRVPPTPGEMRALPTHGEMSVLSTHGEISVLPIHAERSSQDREGQSNDSETPQADVFWPPPREQLHRTTIEVLSLHNLPKVHSFSLRTEALLCTLSCHSLLLRTFLLLPLVDIALSSCPRLLLGSELSSDLASTGTMVSVTSTRRS